LLTLKLVLPNVMIFIAYDFGGQRYKKN